MASRPISIKRGTQNIFADLGYTDAEAHALKAHFVSRIQDAIDERSLTQKEAGDIMGIGQPDVSRMLAGNFRDLSVERLLRFVRAFGYEVDIMVRMPRKPATSRKVRLAAEAV
jgi:predicted XRE-type DNA-binding protein